MENKLFFKLKKNEYQYLPLTILSILVAFYLDWQLLETIYSPSSIGGNCCHNSHLKINTNVQIFYNIQAYAQNILILIDYIYFLFISPLVGKENQNIFHVLLYFQLK